jgi:hypothetical protein
MVLSRDARQYTERRAGQNQAANLYPVLFWREWWLDCRYEVLVT